MAVDLTDVPVGDYLYNSLIYKDVRTLQEPAFGDANRLVKNVLRSVPMEFLCGDSLIKIAIEHREEQLGRYLTEDEEVDLRNKYANVVRATNKQAVGAGLIRLAAISGRKLISVIQLQNSVLTLVNNDLVLRCTVALFNDGLRIWLDDTIFNSNYITALANLQVFMLNNPITLGNRKVIIDIVDPLMPGNPYKSDIRLDAYLTSLDSAMLIKGTTTVPLSSGNRIYNGYKK